MSLTEHIDPTSAVGRRVFHMMAALAEIERALIVERTQAGRAAAMKSADESGGRSPGKTQA